jgi:hypothetical protein
MAKTIKYRDGYRYQLAVDYSVQLDFAPAKDIKTQFIHFNVLGVLTAKAGYAWDGPSGLTIDTKSSMRASLIHDALYQLLREKKLPQKRRKDADEVLHKTGLEDGMFRWRIGAWYRAVRVGAGPAADPVNRKKVITAP